MCRWYRFTRHASANGKNVRSKHQTSVLCRHQFFATEEYSSAADGYRSAPRPRQSRIPTSRTVYHNTVKTKFVLCSRLKKIFFTFSPFSPVDSTRLFSFFSPPPPTITDSSFSRSSSGAPTAHGSRASCSIKCYYRIEYFFTIFNSAILFLYDNAILLHYGEWGGKPTVRFAHRRNCTPENRAKNIRTLIISYVI